jgi:holliday junction DNA helicase RuvA
MISSLRGIVQQIHENELVLDVGGVGFAVAVPASVITQAAPVGEPQFLYTHLVVREDLLQLYGFLSESERQLFLHLLDVSGVGPRTALAALSSMDVHLISSAIVNNQPETLARIPGIGRKTAERIIFQLKDKLVAAPDGGSAGDFDDREVVAALKVLGYSLVEAQIAAQAVPDDPDLPIEDKIRLALQALASGRI